MKRRMLVIGVGLAVFLFSTVLASTLMLYTGQPLEAQGQNSAAVRRKADSLTETKVTPILGNILAQLGAVPQFRLIGRVTPDGVTDGYSLGPDKKLNVQLLTGIASEVIKEKSMTRSGGDATAKARSKFTGKPVTFGVTAVVVNLDALTGVNGIREVEVEVTSIHDASFARAVVRDPIHFTAFPTGEPLAITETLRAGLVLEAQGQTSSAATSVEATTTIPGLETLYTLDIGVSAPDPSLDISFVSNPALGISDSTVENAIASSFDVDQGTGTFTLVSDVVLFDGDLPIPPSVSDFSLAFDDEATATTGGVGGITELLVDGSDAPASAADASGSSAPPYAVIAGIAAAAALALVASGWYARRRWMR